MFTAQGVLALKLEGNVTAQFLAIVFEEGGTIERNTGAGVIIEHHQFGPGSILLLPPESIRESMLRDLAAHKLAANLTVPNGNHKPL